MLDIRRIKAEGGGAKKNTRFYFSLRLELKWKMALMRWMSPAGGGEGDV